MSKPATALEPDRFFAEAQACLQRLRGIPLIAIEKLKEDEASRDVIISIIRQCYEICDNADLDLVEEIRKQDTRGKATGFLKELMSGDNPVTLETLQKNGLKLAFTTNGPVVVPA